MSHKSWIKRFCTLEGNQFLCEVDREYIQDRFNLIGLEEQILHFKEALAIVLHDSSEDNSVDPINKDSSSSYKHRIEILSSAELLYGLIHARYILTEDGLDKMKTKYNKSEFGCCTRFYCEKAAMLPVGLNDKPDKQKVRLYCPRCCDIYVPHLSVSSKFIKIDGAFFGTNFPHMFFMVFPNIRPPKPTKHYTAELYGFRIHPSAYEFQEKKSISAQKARQCPMLHGKHTECNGINGDKNGDSGATLEETTVLPLSKMSDILSSL